MDKQRENIENEEIQDCNMENDNTLPNEELSEAVEPENKEDKDQKKSGLFGKKDKKSKQSTSVDLPEEELNRLQTENAELQDKFLRLYSEFDNYRKR
ncbi:MAG: hypothetical protein LBQ64_06955, partial [Bacteroidales bacterium]|nr:hypothetical protein [Bacteroidales bacterium]